MKQTDPLRYRLLLWCDMLEDRGIDARSARQWSCRQPNVQVLSQDGYGYGYGGNGYGDGYGYGDGDLLPGEKTVNGTKILVMRDGWVVVGHLTCENDNPIFGTLASGYTVRRWGTTTGLGQLAELGPLSETRLDKLPEGVQVNLFDIKIVLPCNVKAWSSVLGEKKAQVVLKPMLRG